MPCPVTTIAIIEQQLCPGTDLWSSRPWEQILRCLGFCVSVLTVHLGPKQSTYEFGSLVIGRTHTHTHRLSVRNGWRRGWGRWRRKGERRELLKWLKSRLRCLLRLVGLLCSIFVVAQATLFIAVALCECLCMTSGAHHRERMSTRCSSPFSPPCLASVPACAGQPIQWYDP